VPRITDVIRLVGGPPKLDGTICDLRLSQYDRVDAADGQFVRVVRGSTITSLASLAAQCHDRRRAAELAAAWRALVYRPTGRVRRRVRVYRFEGHYSLEPRRDTVGRWTVGICARLAGPGLQPPPAATTTVWSALEVAVDEAAGRFAAIAALIPDGPLADRAWSTRQAVSTCVADAARLCAVGATVAPVGPQVVDDQTTALLARVTSLIQTIDMATTQLVELHLEVRDAVDPVEPVATLAQSWAELHPPRHELDGDPFGPLISLPEPEPPVTDR
jgi:hypothetical protein